MGGAARSQGSANETGGRSRLYRDPEGGVILGVCAGIADYFGISTALVRLLAVLGLFVSFPFTLIAYFLAGFLLPIRPPDMYASPEEADFWRQVRRDPQDTAARLRHRFRQLEQRLRGLERYMTSPAYELQKEFRDLED